jgi:hypothetical protein
VRVNPILNPNPNQAPHVAERGVALIGVRSSGNLCVEEVYVYDVFTWEK